MSGREGLLSAVKPWKRSDLSKVTALEMSFPRVPRSTGMVGVLVSEHLFW